MLATTLLLSALPLAAHAAPYIAAREAPSQGSIQWTECVNATDYDFESACATLAVPRDYTEENGETIDLSLLKVKATKEPVLGSIFINTGGPGLDVKTYLIALGKFFGITFGGHYNVIGFDPRGTGDSPIQINCFPNEVDRIVTSIASPSSINESDTSLGETFAIYKTTGLACADAAKDTGELMGTNFYVRDIFEVVDALGEGDKLNFFGQSYGTVVGALAAAMFPDRIGKLVIDGVINTKDYFYDNWELEPLTSGEISLSRYWDQCFAAGEVACPLVKQASSAAELNTKFFDLLDDLRSEPLVLGPNITSDVVRRAEITGAFNNGLRIGILYGVPLAGYLNAIFDRNVTAYREYKALIGVMHPFVVPAIDGVVGIRCSDTEYRARSAEELRPRVQEQLDGSALFGDVFASGYAPCATWPFLAKDRYEGDYVAKTETPALIVGSPYDVRTPIAGAYNVSETLVDSVVLQHNGLGHTMIYSPGKCAIDAIGAYFTDGTLPAPGTVCEQDFDVFSGKTIADSFV